MAKANWISLDKSSGSGNDTVNVSASEHTGRNARTTILTWKAANVADIQRTVSQAGKPEKDTLTMDSQASADKAGKLITIQGTSNSSKLTFSLGAGGTLTDITLPATYKANSISTSNGVAISGDPGATKAYTFEISINILANNDITEKSRQLIVEDAAGNTKTCTIISAAGDAYVEVQEGTIELTYQGTAVPWSVKSNTSWTIE